MPCEIVLVRVHFFKMAAVAKLCEVGSEFNIVCTLVPMATTAILDLFNPQLLPHTTVDIPTKFHEV
jgi:hypothetical protein